MGRINLVVSDCEVLDWVKFRLSIFSDKELARVLETSAPMVSKIRRQHVSLGPRTLLKILELTGVRLSELPTLVNFSKSMIVDQSKIQFNNRKNKYGENYAKSTDNV
jgi:transcriptional regulator with XRE-family HTH domain